MPGFQLEKTFTTGNLKKTNKRHVRAYELNRHRDVSDEQYNFIHAGNVRHRNRDVVANSEPGRVFTNRK